MTLGIQSTEMWRKYYLRLEVQMTRIPYSYQDITLKPVYNAREKSGGRESWREREEADVVSW